MTHRSWREMSTPTLCVGPSRLLFMTVAKFLRINLNELQAVLTYLSTKIQQLFFLIEKIIILKQKKNLHFKFTLQKVSNGRQEEYTQIQAP